MSPTANWTLKRAAFKSNMNADARLLNVDTVDFSIWDNGRGMNVTVILSLPLYGEYSLVLDILSSNNSG
jgi:hypothetical protein